MKVLAIIIVIVSIALVGMLVMVNPPATGDLTQGDIAAPIQERATELGIDYLSVVNRAVNNDLDALTELIAFTEKTQGAARVGHRVVLKELHKRLGRGKFEKALQPLGETARPYIAWLESGEPAVPNPQ